MTGEDHLESTETETNGSTDARSQLDEIFNAELEVRRIETKVEEIKGDLKKAKDRLDNKILALRRLCNHQAEREKAEANDRDRPIIQRCEQAEREKTEADAWESLSISVLLDPPIKGFGAKKVEALTSLCPTLGDFEALRGNVGQDAAELHELLPKGIGKEAATTLEERLLDWATGKKRPEPAEEPAASDIPENDPERRANELSHVCDFSSVERDEVWRSGFACFEDEGQIADCPWLPGDKQDRWICGWMSAEAESSLNHASLEDL